MVGFLVYMIGIYGGTFDPPHAGHIHVATTLQKFLHLREVWWVVTKRNSLKPACSEGLLQRKAQVRILLYNYAKMRLIDDLESARSIDVVQQLHRRHPSEKFVFIAGTDVILGLHKWFRWKELCVTMPIIFLERPGYIYNVIHRPFCAAIERIPHPNHESIREVSSGWGIVRAGRNFMSSSSIRRQRMCRKSLNNE
ncbi:nucleotidyl transferase family protein [Anaplasma platys]|nr:nicotinate-nicotinamide nucleotide adenylyltransferase [Anaplasma platys]